MSGIRVRKVNKMYHLTWTERAGKPALKVLDLGVDQLKRIVYAEFPFKPYFFIPADALDVDAENAIHEVDPFAVISETDAQWKNMKLVKVEMAKPDYVRDARERLISLGIQTYEADIPYAHRVLIDTGWSVEKPEHILYFDIEVNSQKGFPRPETADARILSIACVDQSGLVYTFTNDNEPKMIKDFLEVSKRYEVIAGYNSGNFDWPYLQNRCKRLGIQFDWFELIHIDLLPLYKLMTMRKRPTSYKLETVAQEDLGESKIKPNWKMTEIYDIWRTREGREEVLVYNIQDAQLVKKLDEKYKMIDIIFSIAKITHTTVPALINQDKLTHGLNNSVAVDGLVLSIARKRNPRIVFPSKVHRAQDEEQSYPGAMVFEPVPGKHEKVANLDFSSLYPSIIRSFNIGVDTYCREGDAEIKAEIGSFYSEPKSILAEAIEVMGKKRAELKHARNQLNPASSQWQILYAQEYAIKQLLLSFYGVIGYQGSRYYDVDVASNVSLLGQSFIKKAADIAREHDCQVIYGDTDSLFVKFANTSQDIVAQATELRDIINSSLKTWAKEKYNVKNLYVEMDVERIYSQIMMFQAKKRYAGIVIWQSGLPTCYLHMVGLEATRKDWPEAVREYQTELLKMLLTGASDADVLAYMRDTKRRLFCGELDAKLVMHKGMNMEMDEYKANAIHVKVAKKMVDAGHDVKLGDKIAFIRVGDGDDGILAVVDGKIPPISQKGYEFIWQNQFGAITERLGLTNIGMKRIDSGEWT